MKRLTRIIAPITVGLYAMLGFPGAALAHTDPIGPGSARDAVTTGVPSVPAPAVTSSGWSPAVVIAVGVLIMLGAALVIGSRRLSQRRRRSRRVAFST